MSNASGQSQNCYCAFCRTPKRSPDRKAIGFLNVLGSVFTSLVLMVALWQEFDPRVFIIFVICLAIAEVFIQLRWRMSVICQKCGFDPVLYAKSPSLAAAKVKEQLERRKTDPRFLLSGKINLPTITPARAEELAKIQEQGSVLSRTV